MMKSSSRPGGGAPTPSSVKQRRSRAPKENVDPYSLQPPPESSSFRPPSAVAKPLVVHNRSPLPPRPLKRKLSSEPLPEIGAPQASVAPDSGVQVIVRIRPPRKEEDEGDRFVRRISSDSISVADQSFTFDSVADTGSRQHDIFQLVGLPLVENCLAGFNSSIFAYGQTGSGKTYTMWGPISALSVEESSTEWGLTPRIFQRLFTRINEEQSKHSDKRLSYQCCCSFLEIYNEQITDLLDSTQKNLQIREDVKTGVYVDYLTEEYVSSVKDVVQLLIKGLANRRTGATCANAESSRSHCVFTCVVESRSKSMADGLSSVRTSKINLVDLAGSERQKLTTAEGERLKEAGNINRSLSQLGNLINILAEVSLSRKQRHIPYRDSKLTFLLQDSLGGNAKLAMICAISASQCCQNETFSTLRFAQRAKAIKNKAIVNEITQDDVNILQEQIHQLKDELLRMKSTGSSGESNGSCSTGWNARRSLNLLRQSLNCPAALSVVEGDSDEEMEIDQEDLERSCIQADAMSTSCEESKLEVQNVHSEYPNEVKSSCSDSKMVPENLHPVFTTRSGCGGDRAFGSTNVINESCRFVEVGQVQVSVEGCELVGTSKVQICPESNEKEASYRDDCEDIIMLTDDKSLDSGSTLLISGGENLVFVIGDSHREEKGLEGKASVIKSCLVGSDSVKSLLKDQPHSSAPADAILPSNFSIGPQQISACLHSPTLNTSPRVENYSLRSSISTSASQTNKVMNVDSNSGVLNLSFADALAITPSSSSAPNLSSLPPTEHLEASLLCGLQVIDSHQHNSALRRSSFSFPVKSVDLKPLAPVNRVNVGIQTSSEKSDTLEESSFVCNRCKNHAPPLDYMDAKSDMDFQLGPTNGSQLVDKYKKHVPKAVERVLAGAIRREMALQDHFAKQAAEILQLNQLIQQYKHERECNAILEQTREDKINRLEGLMDGILPTEEFMEEEFILLRNEHNLLKEKYENHPDILRLNIELNKVQNELDEYRNFHDMGERDVLMEEIQDLRNQLQFYVASSHMPTQRRSPCHKLTGINGNNLSAAKKSELTEEYVNEKFEEERRHWTETESRWISLSEELRLELESSQSLAQKWKNELDSEKKCTEELKEALQMAMQGHARLLDQYADLQEKHIVLLARHRKISDGIQDVKKAAAKAGIKGAAYRFIKSLAAEISAIKVEKEKERQHLRGENKRLQAQVRDTAEAIQAAGELLVRLKEAEETAALSQRRALEAEQKAEKAYEEIDMLKKNHERKICMLNQFLAESCLPKEALRPAFSDDNVVKYGGESLNEIQRGWEFEHSYQENKEFSGHSEPSSWFPGHDQCNI